MCIRYYQVDPCYSNMMCNLADIHWRMLNHIMSQYYLHYLGIFKLKGLRWLLTRQQVADGNFSAQHMNMLNPQDDVGLTDGEGYMTNVANYEAHLEDAKESKQVSLVTYSVSC